MPSQRSSNQPTSSPATTAANNEKAVAWAKATGKGAATGSFEQVGAGSDIVFNCTLGSGALEALHMAKESNLAGKIVVDVSNPLDTSKGMPPSLLVSNTDSLGEQIQRAFPKAKVVKTLNTMWCGLMVNPRMLPDTHVNFLATDLSESSWWDGPRCDTLVTSACLN